jgi:hypothetical protein
MDFDVLLRYSLFGICVLIIIAIGVVRVLRNM